MPLSKNENTFPEKIRQLIANHLSEPGFGVAELADSVAMHRSSLSRKLLERTGKSPSQLIEVMRMEEALNLLLATGMSIANIARKVGYAELSNFSRAFKRHLGGSPSKIRNSAVLTHRSGGDATN